MSEQDCSFRKTATRAIHAICRSVSTSLDVFVVIWFITRTFLYLYCVIIYCCIHVFDNRAVPVMRCQWWHSACIHYCFIITQVVLCLRFNVANLSEEYGGNREWREFPFPGIPVRISFIFSRSTSRNEFLFLVLVSKHEIDRKVFLFSSQKWYFHSNLSRKTT